MKFLKQLLIGLIGLSLVVIAISSFLPSTVRISRGIFIHANPTEVFSTVKDLSTLEGLESNTAGLFCEIFTYRRRRIAMAIR